MSASAHAERGADAAKREVKKPSLTEDAVQRAFGDSKQPLPGHAHRGSGPARPMARIVMPTAKVLSDAASLQSAVQSVLPLDPRERLYYRPRRHLLQCTVLRHRAEGSVLAGLRSGAASSVMTDRFVVDYMNECMLYAIVAPRGGLRFVTSAAFCAHNSNKVKDAVLVEGTVGDSKGVVYSIKDCVEKAVFTISAPHASSSSHGEESAVKASDVRAAIEESVVGVLCQCHKGRDMVLLARDPDGVCVELAAILFDTDEDEQTRFKVILPASHHCPASTPGTHDGAADSIYTPAESAVTRAAAERARRRQEGGSSATVRAQARSALVMEYEQHAQSPHIVTLSNKSAEWDNAVRGYKLDFHGRASVVSEKNFQLINATDPSQLLMSFGKQAEDAFSMDFRLPLSGLQAAAIATTILHKRDW